MSDNKVYICENLSAAGSYDSVSGQYCYESSDETAVAAVQEFARLLEAKRIGEVGAHVYLAYDNEVFDKDLILDPKKAYVDKYENDYSGYVPFLPSPVTVGDREWNDTFSFSPSGLKFGCTHVLAGEGAQYSTSTNGKTATVTMWYTIELPFNEKAGLPDMNVTHEHKETAKNGIELIIKALLGPGVEEEAQNNEMVADLLHNPGYSPMERLTKAVVNYIANSGRNPWIMEIPSEYNGDALAYFMDCAYGRDYPNDLERIAAVIRGDIGDMWQTVKKAVYNGSITETANHDHEIDLDIEVGDDPSVLAGMPLIITVNGKSYENNGSYDGSSNTYSSYRWVVYDDSEVATLKYEYPKNDPTAGKWYIAFNSDGDYAVKVESTEMKKRGE